VKAAEIMQRDVVTVASGSSLADAAHLLLAHGINAVPVIADSGRVIGVVGVRDVLRAPMPSHSDGRILRYDGIEDKARSLTTTTVDQVMSRRLVSVVEDESVMEVAALMANRGVHPILVLRDGRLVGVIGRADVARLLVSLLAAIDGNDATSAGRSGLVAIGETHGALL
jgi:CBS-domain-containing membrane protein